MTSKEFIRRVNAFKPLDSACKILDNSLFDCVYRVNCFCGSSRLEYYFPSVERCSDFIRDLDCLDTVVIERFSRQWFNVQFRYFCGFVNRLSKCQLEGLRNIIELENLYNRYISHADKQ